jgi:hypothetical protein
MQEQLRQAADWIHNADGLLLTAGAGMGVDSGTAAGGISSGSARTTGKCRAGVPSVCGVAGLRSCGNWTNCLQSGDMKWIQ